MENANKPASSWPLKQGPKKWSKHGCDKGTLTVATGLGTHFFFRPTPLGFRQVVQHVRLHVATSELTNYCNDVGSSMTASTVELARTDT